MIKKSLSIAITTIILNSCIPKEELFPHFKKFEPELSQKAIEQCMKENPGVKESSCNIKNCFISPLMLLALQELLIEVDKAFKEIKVPYFLDGGTGISAYRGFLLPWDDDADVSVLREDFTSEKKQAFKKYLGSQGFYFAPYSSPEFLNKAYGLDGFYQVSYGKSRFLSLIYRYNPTINYVDAENLWQTYYYSLSHFPSLDIFEFIEKEPGKYTYAKPDIAASWKGKLMDKNKLFGSKTRELLGRQYPVAEDEKELFKLTYGTDDILNDIVIFQEHIPICEKLRFKDIRKNPELLDYMFSYLKFVFGNDFDEAAAKSRYSDKTKDL
jgi:hypothetical protein